MHSDVTAYEAKTKLPELLRRVEAGESFTITRRGRPVAEITAVRQRQLSGAEAARSMRDFWLTKHRPEAAFLDRAALHEDH
jgi:prevent-host-death family protein